ncbi:MAG: UDP-N-acetylmuramate dehydrogenase [bacterium]|nr:UDP-N-acetylmuramate dehydrogenase [bacterium]
MDAGERFLSLLPEDLRGSVRRGLPLSGLTTLRVGGPAALVCPVQNPEQALRFQQTADQAGLPWFVLGGGSNVLADDRGFGGAILKIEAVGLERQGDAIAVQAGMPFDALVAATLAEGLCGLEFASGIPGSVGGALAGNAGCYGREIRDLVGEVTVLTPGGRIERRGPEECGFRYRGSALRDAGDIVLSAVLRLHRGGLDAAVAERNAHLADRRAKHPVTEPSAGSWFRNLDPAEPGGRRQPAGVLLEEAGAKQMREGDAAVFARHANIIVNLGHARSDEVRRLVSRMREAVQRRFDVLLQEEVRYLDPSAPAGRTI